MKSSEILALAKLPSSSSSSLAQAQQALTASQLTQSEHLNYYAAQIEAHARAIVRLNEVLEKLDRLLDRKGNEGI